jgi:HK97 family phage portal protein
VEGVAPFLSTGSDAGKQVSMQSSLQYSAAFAGIRLISETIATLPIGVYTTTGDVKNRVPTTDPLFRLLAVSPNARMTPVEFWEMFVASLLGWGNAYAVLQRIGKRVVALDPLRPEFTTVYRTAAGDIRYAFKRGSVVEDYAAADILHVKAFGVDGLVGLSPIGQAHNTIGRALATDEASGNVFRNGMTAGGVVEVSDAKLTKEQRNDIRQTVDTFTGSGRYAKTLVLESGMKYSQITMSPSDVQLLESRDANFEEVCTWFGVPPSLVQHMDKASSWAASLESTKQSFLQFTLRPYLVRIEQSLAKALVLPPDVSVRFGTRELLRGDTAARTAYYASGLQNGYLNRNTVAMEEGENPIGPDGEVYTVQSNLIPLDKLGELGGQSAAPAVEPLK